MQIAIVLPDEQVDELDRLVPEQYPSRAEAVRTAVSGWLAERRAREVDETLIAGYALAPASIDDISSGAATAGGGEPPGWENLEW